MPSHFEHLHTTSGETLSKRGARFFCAECTHWEPEGDNRAFIPRKMAPKGWCPIFDKHTTWDHGHQCTAWEALPNEQAER